MTLFACKVPSPRPFPRCPSCVCECPAEAKENPILPPKPEGDSGQTSPAVPRSDPEDKEDEVAGKEEDDEDEASLFRRQQERIDAILGLIDDDGEGGAEEENAIGLEEKGEGMNKLQSFPIP